MNNRGIAEKLFTKYELTQKNSRLAFVMATKADQHVMINDDKFAQPFLIKGSATR